MQLSKSVLSGYSAKTNLYSVNQSIKSHVALSKLNKNIKKHILLGYRNVGAKIIELYFMSQCISNLTLYSRG